jgi:RNA polymerase sigma factor (sigma-70 family)
MANTPETGREGAEPRGMVADNPALEEWFLREVLPLEAMLMRYLQHNWRNQSDIKDMLQDIYVRVCEAAQTEFPHSTKPFVFTVARNLLLNRVRDAQVVPIEAVADVEALAIAVDEPGPDQSAVARDELRRLQSALDRLPPRAREAVVLKQVDGLSRREIARQMGIGEETVKDHLSAGLRQLSDIFFGEPADFRRRK